MTDEFVAFARERSHRDVESTGEYGRLMVQFVAAANGLAATAILTLIGTFKSEILGLVMAVPLAFYMVGTFYALGAAKAFYSSQDKFASMWERRSYPDTADRDEAERLFKQACNIKGDALEAIGKSLFCFINGGAIAAVLMIGYFFNATAMQVSNKAYTIDCTNVLPLHCTGREVRDKPQP